MKIMYLFQTISEFLKYLGFTFRILQNKQITLTIILKINLHI